MESRNLSHNGSKRPMRRASLLYISKSGSSCLIGIACSQGSSLYLIIYKLFELFLQTNCKGNLGMSFSPCMLRKQKIVYFGLGLGLGLKLLFSSRTLLSEQLHYPHLKEYQRLKMGNALAQDTRMTWHILLPNSFIDSCLWMDVYRLCLDTTTTIPTRATVATILQRDFVIRVATLKRHLLP